MATFYPTLPIPPVAIFGLAICLTWAVYTTTTAVYRLYFHPLAKFPGPRAACLSNKWVLEQSKAGTPEEVFERLHREYGTHAIRIAPNELHISDLSLYRSIYSQTSPYLKYAEFYGAFGVPHTLFTEDDPTLHKARQRMLSPFFSRAGILKIEPAMVAKIKQLLARIDGLRQTQSINLYNAFRCVTVDIISEYAFARSIGLISNSDNNFHGGYLIAFEVASTVIWDMAYHPTMRKIFMMIPKFIARAVSKELDAILSLEDESARSLIAYRSQSKLSKSGYPVIFDGLTELADDLITTEAVATLAAGSDTTAFSLSVGMWHILQDLKIKEKLVGALQEEIPNLESFPSLTKLECIPYLIACVRESIRVANGVPGRLPRVVPQGANLIVDGKAVPPGTVVGMSAYTMNRSEELWGPDARAFDPERWLGETGKALDQHMGSFSKGLRSCIGQNLAYAEMTLAIAYILRSYDVKLCKGSATADGVDAFTSKIKKPGILVDITPRAQ